MTTVKVDLGPRSYEIRVVSGDSGGFGGFVRAALDAKWSGRGCRSALVVTDDNLHGAIRGPVEALAEIGITSEVASVPPGEASKSLAVASTLFDRLVAMKADRHTAIVAVGGGVIGDLAGFVASAYARGLPLVMIPTTLLAQVDSSVGGKVGVNHPGAKNIIGAFHQPVGVWIDTDSLLTLPPREVRCGMAEVIKYGVILDADFFDSLERDAAAIRDGDRALIRAMIARCCRIKADVVSQDEREETGLRAVLNFGHTIGHAVEAVAGYGGGYQHGEAVAIGMVAESRLAERMGWIGPDATARMVRLLEAFGLPTVAPGLDVAGLRDAMGRDKKNQGGRVRFVLPRAIGRVEMAEAPDQDIRAVLAEMVAHPGSGGR
ncbi:3-dehydroquinate synthase [Tundrisphaera sp. TA3]|uniref:3-dehydroquinate synthase n=1 Tax=Tundrisphaera sp. TA3 TaxID=3435775 RepID=UPI003EB719D2